MSLMARHLRLVGLVFGLGLAAAACTDEYGYGEINTGYADPYYAAGYNGYPSYAGYGGFGWYGDYYYPGTGFYVYDRARRPYRWNDSQRRYWEGRHRDYRGSSRGNWGGFVSRSNDRGRGFRYNHGGQIFRGTGPPGLGSDGTDSRSSGIHQGHRADRSVGAPSRGRYDGRRNGGGRHSR